VKSVEKISAKVVIVGTVALSGSKPSLSKVIAKKYAIHITPNAKGGRAIKKVLRIQYVYGV